MIWKWLGCIPNQITRKAIPIESKSFFGAINLKIMISIFFNSIGSAWLGNDSIGQSKSDKYRIYASDIYARNSSIVFMFLFVSVIQFIHLYLTFKGY